MKGKVWALCYGLRKPPWKYHMVTWMLQPHSLSGQMVGSLVSLTYTKEYPHFPEEVNILQIPRRRRKSLMGFWWFSYGEL